MVAGARATPGKISYPSGLVGTSPHLAMGWLKLRMPEVEQRLKELVIPPSPTTRDEFDKFMRAEIARWAQVIKDAKIPKQ
jgi:hypothetical protein